VVLLTDGLTKPVNWFQVTPPSILKNWSCNPLSLLALSTLPANNRQRPALGRAGKDLVHGVFCKRKVSTARPFQTESTRGPRGYLLRTSGAGPELASHGAEQEGAGEDAAAWPRSLPYGRALADPPPPTRKARSAFA